MESLSQLKKLDDMLRHIYDQHKSDPTDIWIDDIKDFVKISPDIDLNELLPILNKLVKDKYLDFHPRETQKTFSFSNNDFTLETEKYYSITFEGIFFIQIGGYVAQEELKSSDDARLKKLEKRNRKTQNKIKNFTVWIAIGAIIASAYYLYFLIQDLCDCQFIWQK